MKIELEVVKHPKGHEEYFDRDGVAWFHADEYEKAIDHAWEEGKKQGIADAGLGIFTDEKYDGSLPDFVAHLLNVPSERELKARLATIVGWEMDRDMRFVMHKLAKALLSLYQGWNNAAEAHEDLGDMTHAFAKHVVDEVFPTVDSLEYFLQDNPEIEAEFGLDKLEKAELRDWDTEGRELLREVVERFDSYTFGEEFGDCQFGCSVSVFDRKSHAPNCLWTRLCKYTGYNEE